MPYNPGLHTATNKPYGMGQAGPTDARSYFYDEAAFTYRPYASTAEVLAYLNQPTYRTGNFSMFIMTAGAVTEYWFKDGTADNNLVEKKFGGGDTATSTTAGTVQLATDVEMQVIAAPPDDIKVPNRLRIFNWWNNFITKTAQVMLFNIVKMSGAANATPHEGDVWYAAPDYMVKKTDPAPAEAVVTITTNITLSGGTERVVTAGTGGGLLANYDLLEEIVTDTDILAACNGATYNSGNSYTATIAPANSKIIFKGQIARGTAYIYKAMDDNSVTRIPLG